MPLGSFESLPFRHGCAATLSPFHGDSFWLVLPPACPERGFEPSAPGGRCSEGRIGRNREYCKQQRSKTTIFQPALWMRAKRADGGVASGLLLFASTPSVKPSVCHLPRQGAFGCGTSSNPKAVPACGESGTKCRKGNGSKKPSAVRYSPSVCSLSFTDSSPASGGAFWLSPNRKEPHWGSFHCLLILPYSYLQP